MNCTIIIIATALLLSGCAANKEKYELAKHRVTAAVSMYTALQTTRQVEALSKETVAMASMGFVEKGCGNECDKPKKKTTKKKEVMSKDCSNILKKYDEKCDSAKTGHEVEEVCNDLYAALETEKKRCEEDNKEVNDDSVRHADKEVNDDESTGTETVKVDKEKGVNEIDKAIAKATAESTGGSTVINNFIGDNNTSGSYNPTASGAGSVFMGGDSARKGNTLDAEAASILSLAGKDVQSDTTEIAEGYFKPALDTAKAVAWPIAAGYALGEGFKASGDKNSNNPQYDLSDNSTNINQVPEPVAEKVLE